MIERFHVIMPFSRPQLIEPVMDFWLRMLDPHPFELRLYVFVQGPEPDPYGVRKINEGLNLLRADYRPGWLYTANDDTVHSPGLLAAVAADYALRPDAGAIVFSEIRPKRDPAGEFLLAAPENMRRSHVDGQQIVWRTDFIRYELLDFAAFGPQVDGGMVEKLFARSPQRFVFDPRPLVNFNSLTP